jgi:hypothetical protein
MKFSLLLALPDAAANVDRKMPAKDIKTDLTIPQRHSNMERLRFVQLINLTDQCWMNVLGDELFHDLNYYDLFTKMWLKHDHVFHKSELHQLMPNISQRTAVKYVQIAIDHGLLIEHTDPQDLRSKQITMSADLKRKIELFLDYSISVFETFSPSSPLPMRRGERKNRRAD